ncbi:MAG: hypothetical protein PVI26_09805 [Chitinispirillia bacterium]|jgi:hypothetical protein
MKNKFDDPTEWLLEGPAFVRYRTLEDLLGKKENSREVKAAYTDMIADPLVKALIQDVNDWEQQPVLTRHNNAVHTLHKLVFAATIGIKRNLLQPAVNSILSHQSVDGPFQIRIMIPRAFGGDDIPKWDWVATDAPLVLYSLLRLGFRSEKVMKGVHHIRTRIAKPGFPCFASSSMGKFKGPGKKTDPCPYANLIILRMLSQVPELLNSPEARSAASMLLHHWQVRKKQKYFLFGIGTDFAKPKVPRVWYDIIHYTDTLARFPFVREDRRLREAFDLLASQADEQGRFLSKSIWTRWKGWEFCQKKEHSYWITFLAHRALRRMGD